MTTFTIRRLTPADLAAYRALRDEGLVRDSDAFRISVADDDALGEQAWRDRLARDFVVGVERGGQLVGIGGFARLPGEKASHKGLIWGMYVHPDARGAGVADLIMTTLLDFARSCVRQVQLTVAADNPRAVAFYERHGFIGYGVEPASIRRDRPEGSVYADEALMWRLV